MSIKKRRKTRRDTTRYTDDSEMELRRLRPNLYKKPQQRGRLYYDFFEHTSARQLHRKQVRVKGMPKRIAEEIAMIS
ncbi:MAG: hypothetical protein FVQ79_09760 [Planctomycetes bacterium]|nr:hypothetical protein [Planctomycetota bacterium]